MVVSPGTMKTRLNKCVIEYLLFIEVSFFKLYRGAVGSASDL